ncbi:MAG TPA: Gfo/Idh/MocA family oxidoreductase [Polyangiaceae bacterium]|nr:Gfo/Idh/MocA family oxidoreductase [Polyangiaceae bacterium]
MSERAQAGRAEAPLRYVLLGGAATIAKAHTEAISEIPGAVLVGMCDIDRARGESRAREARCAFFADHRALLAELRPDAAVICTPHPLHAPQAKDCLAEGAHVLVEKPLAIDVADGDELVRFAEERERVLAVNFQERFRPAVERARAFIGRGELGAMVRVLAVESRIRNAAYYRSASWRGTWQGEGGGVLVNQAQHALDVLCHVAGMPSRVWGVTRTRLHAMECEDTAHAMLEYEGGAIGYVTVSTAEAGAASGLEIVGDRAVLKLTGDELTVVRLETPLGEHIAADRAPLGLGTERAAIFARSRGHVAVHEDFAAAIRHGKRPRCDGHDGLMSLELANAITLSSLRDRAVALPLDRAAYSTLLDDLRAGRAAVPRSRSRTSG